MFFLRELPTRQMLAGYRDRFPHMNVEAVEGAFQLLRRASVLMRRLDAHFAAHGSSQLRFLILVVIDREPDRDALTFGELAERLDVSRPVITRTLRALSEAGEVVVEADGADARSKRVRLTRAGKNKLDAILPDYYRIIEAFMADPDAAATDGDTAATPDGHARG